MGWTSLLGGITSLYSAYQNHKDSQDQIALGYAQLEETKEQNAYEREKYETALANQTEGITALGNVFGNVLESQNSSTSTDSTASTIDSSGITGSTTDSSTLDSSTTASANSNASVTSGGGDTSVPTQRD